MKKSEKNKPAAIWLERLFHQSGNPILGTLRKRPFSQQYPYRNDESISCEFASFFAGPENFDSSTLSQMLPKRVPFEADASWIPTSNASIGRQGNSTFAADSTGLREFTVLNIFQETSDTKTFRFRPKDSRDFRYLPGQFVTLTLEIGGRIYKRSYSLASSPLRLGTIEITVKKVEGGLVSNWLNDHLKIGDTVKLKGPFGNFSCVKHTRAKLLFMAAGSGIVPVMSMLRWLTDSGTRTDIFLMLSFKTQYDIIYQDELNFIKARHPNVSLFITLTREQSEYLHAPKHLGRINQRIISEAIPDLAERSVFLCGPDDFMDACKSHLEALKLPDGQLFRESFTTNIGVTTPLSRLAKGISSVVGDYHVRFAKTGKTQPADGSVSVLELARRSGIDIEHECLSGSCGVCMVKCLEGKMNMSDQAEIDERDRKNGWVYACCAYPASDAVLDI